MYEDNIINVLDSIDACDAAQAWAQQHTDKTLQQVWEVCENPDWMFWLLTVMDKEHDQKNHDLCEAFVAYIDQQVATGAKNYAAVSLVRSCIRDARTWPEVDDGLMGYVSTYLATGYHHYTYTNGKELCDVIRSVWKEAPPYSNFAKRVSDIQDYNDDNDDDREYDDGNNDE